MDTKTVGLIGTIVKAIIAVLGAVFCILIIVNSDSISGGENVNYLDMALKVTYVAMILCIAAALLFGIYYFITNIGKSKGMLFAFIGFAAVLGVSYAMAKSDVSPAWAADGITEKVSKLTSMGITAVLLLLGIAVVMALFSEVSRLLK